MSGRTPDYAFSGMNEPPHETEFDALAELFLGDQDDADLPPRASAIPDELALPVTHAVEPKAVRPPSATARPRLHVEAVLLGHLPVRAGLWVNQYARQLAARLGGPVAVLRVREGAMTVSLVGDREAWDEDDATMSPRAAVSAAVARSVAAIVEVGELDEPGLVELALSGRRLLDAVTVLSGADDAAAVAAYRAAKRLAEAIDAASGDGALAPAPALRAAVFGADPVRAQAAATKLVKASGSFLGGAIEAEACASRIGGPRVRELCHAELEADPATVLEWVRAGEPAPSRRPSPGVGGPTLRLSTETADESLHEPMDDAFTAQATPPRGEGAKPEAGESREPGAAPSPSAGPAVAGLRLLELSCPAAPGVHLAGDAGGALHLIAIERGEDVAHGVAGVARGTAAQHLAAAEAWARTNAALLQAAARVDATSPTMHLLTDEPKRVRGLLDSAIRVHLAVEVAVEGESRRVWVCRSLN